MATDLSAVTGGDVDPPTSRRRRRRAAITIVVARITVAAAAGLVASGAGRPVARVTAEGRRAHLRPAAVGADYGERVRLADFAGRPLLANFWASWCVPCRKEMPALQSPSSRLSKLTSRGDPVRA